MDPKRAVQAQFSQVAQSYSTSPVFSEGVDLAAIGREAAALRAAAERAGRAIELDAIVYRDAFEALGRGDGAEHDRRLGEKIRAYADRDVIVLGQASMARVLPTLPPNLAARTLTSPTLAVETSRRAIDGR